MTAFTCEDNSPRFSDFVARGRRKGGGGAADNDFRADIGPNDFSNPSTLAVGPEARLQYGARVLIDGYGWLLIEDHTAAGLEHAPRFDVWTAGATQAEAAKPTGFREVTVFPPGSDIPQPWCQRKASPAWDWTTWTSQQRIAKLRSDAGPRCHGIYIQGQLVV